MALIDIRTDEGVPPEARQWQDERRRVRGQTRCPGDRWLGGVGRHEHNLHHRGHRGIERRVSVATLA